MSNFLKAQVSLALIYVFGAVLLLALVFGLTLFFRKHPAKTKFLQMVRDLTADAVAELATQDTDGRTKMHGVIDEVIRNLQIAGVHIPNNISNIIENAAERALIDLKAQKAIINNTEVKDSSSNKALVEPTDTDTDIDTNISAPVPEETANDTDTTNVDVPVAPEDAEEKDEVATPVLSINGVKPDETGNIILPLKGDKE